MFVFCLTLQAFVQLLYVELREDITFTLNSEIQ